VRRAEADLELTLYGWSKTPNSVDQLIALAKSDPASRPSALYSLGILAGDGVASERAHQFILDTARNNPDPTARQWATQGLSFVGTDAALDELFEIFTHDPSFAVRDRAGCNVSDCGSFERKQRLRMVPRLIDLVSDPHANPQMRNWSFLALREITEENLPSDAAAWRRWYDDKASAKQAQFAALDWWRVRGDY
jgi:HEAT repeats